MTVLVAIDIYHPSLLINLDNAPNDYVANVRSVPRTKWTYADHLVYLMNDAGHTCIDRFLRSRVLLARIGSVTSNKALSDVVTRQNNLLCSKLLLLFTIINFEILRILHLLLLPLVLTGFVFHLNVAFLLVIVGFHFFKSI